MIHGRRAELTAGVVTVWVAIEIGGEASHVSFQLTLAVECGSCMVQVGHAWTQYRQEIEGVRVGGWEGGRRKYCKARVT